MISEKIIEKTIEIPIAKMWRQEGIIYVKFIDKLDMSLENAQSGVKARVKLSEGMSYPVLIDMRGIKSVTKEAREYLADEGAKLIKAGALIVGSPLNRTLGNIFLWVNKPKVPTRLFTDEEEALKWLEQYL